MNEMSLTKPNRPCTLRVGFLTGFGLLIAGLLLQVALGAIEWTCLAFPTNLFALVVFLLCVLEAYTLQPKVPILKYMNTWRAALPCLVWAMGLTAIMGLTRQVTPTTQASDLLSFSKMQTSWCFVLIFLWMAFILSLAAIDRLVHFRFRTLPTLLSHFGLLLVLIGGTLGAADRQKFLLHASLHRSECFAVDAQHQVHQLPFAIELKHFTLERYAPAIDRTQTPNSLQTEPCNYASEILIYTEDGSIKEATIEVNKPYRIKDWRIYQYAYGNEEKKNSYFSVFEIVYDPWLPVVYTGIAMLATGALALFFFAGQYPIKRD